MAIKKSKIYPQLWAACDQLRGGVEPLHYKNYILTLLFVKYVSDRFKNSNDWEIEIPEGGSFDDIVALKNKKNIGEGINVIIGKLAEKNNLKGVIDIADFNSEELGSGDEAVTKLTNLIAIFQKPELDFSTNRAEGDDILGDAYEFLMRKFAQASGKNKGQFYTPAEVSRVMAKVIGIDKANSASMTVYDPACGSGSLLIRAANEAPCDISIYGQELDQVTAGLARMNLVLHNRGAGEIVGNKSTLAHPAFKNEINPNLLKTFNFIVVNPPFSDKAWTNGITIPDKYGRFNKTYLGVPPEKNGDYAWFLHVLKSMNPQNGKAAIILPHGVLFRGNAEEEIRKKIIDRGYIKCIIDLPINLFYGTGIAACIIILDKEDAATRKGIFMIDASKGYKKDGNKNRLREQDVYKIVTTYLNMDESDPKYARFVSLKEIKEDNDCNLNISRYIDNSEPEDLQDIEAHLSGGIPEKDIESLSQYWSVYPSLKTELFKILRNGYYKILVSEDEISEKIAQNYEFIEYNRKIREAYSEWSKDIFAELSNLNTSSNPKKLIVLLGEKLLQHFNNLPLINKYDVYEILMDYWTEVMQDDVYIVCREGYEAGREIEEYGISRSLNFDGKLIPKDLIAYNFFYEEAMSIELLRNDLNVISEEIKFMKEENSGEDGIFTQFDNLKRTTITTRLREIENNEIYFDEYTLLKRYLELVDREKKQKDELKKEENKLKNMIKEQYRNLSLEQIKEILIEKKWFDSIGNGIDLINEIITQYLTKRIKELVKRYEFTLKEYESDVTTYEEKVKSHLERMGFEC